ncbi:MAG: hypothetical protein ACYTFY_11180 [Planctomycetota bacterium]|jgi:hypothetical protein
MKHVFLILMLCLLTGTSLHSAEKKKTAGIHCNGMYCREVEDREWHVRVAGKVTSPAGVYVVMTNSENKVVFRGKVPRGEYPSEKPYEFKVPKDGITGDYLITVFGTQRDYAGIKLPYTDLPFEVYGKAEEGKSKLNEKVINGRTFLHLNHGTADQFYFKLSSGVKKLTFFQSDSAWTITDVDGNVAYDVRKEGESYRLKRNNKIIWTGTFEGKPDTFYRLGKNMFWIFATPKVYVAISPERWFEPDKNLKLNISWWRDGK